MEINLKDIDEGSMLNSPVEDVNTDILGRFHDLNIHRERKGNGEVEQTEISSSNPDSKNELQNPIVSIPSRSISGDKGLQSSLSAALHADSPQDSVSSTPSYGIVDHQDKSLPMSPKILSSKELMKLDPLDLARKLFDESLEGFSRAMVCPIIGKGDEFHQKVLVAYMERFDFHAISLDEAFRRFCIQLHLTGETQAVDRILFQMSLRYWKCNSEIQNMYRNIDIVYGTLFSIVLLNTDLNTVNIGPKANKKMPLKVFIKNTLSLLEGLIDKDPVLSKDLAGAPEAYKNWKRDLENTLKDIYNSVRDNPIVQNNPGKLPTSSSLNKSSTSSVSNNNFNNNNNNVGGRFGFLKKGKSVASLFESPRDSPKSPPLTASSISQVVIEGVLIRKHVLADDGEKAAVRRWTKLWCAIKLSKDMGVELMMNKLSYEDKDYAESEQDTPVQYGETEEYPVISSPEVLEKHLQYQMNPVRTTLSIGAKYYALDSDCIVMPSHPLLFSPTHEYKLVYQEAETFSLIHSFATSHFHGPQREHCLALHLANNHVYLFHAPTSDASRAWIETINYWAAKKSREPLHGSIGNVDYGWASLTGTASHSEPAVGSSMEIDRMQSTDSGSSNGGVRTPQRRFIKGIKFVKWTDIPLSSRLVSNKDDNEQMQCMFKQIQFVRKDIEEHEAVKDLMEDSLVDHPQFSLAVNNWNRKADCLFKELEKYEIYTRSLQACIIAEQNQPPEEKKQILSEKEMQIFQAI